MTPPFSEEIQALALGFGRNARLLRERKGISQEAFADMVGVHRTEVSAIERGKREPRLSTVLLIARGLDVEPHLLLEGLSAPRERRPRPHTSVRSGAKE
jgi:transcriptional regulator with XRE-family HTH domain